MESDKHLLATAEGWRAKVACRPENRLGQFIVGRLVLLKVERDDFLALGGPYFSGRSSNFQRFGTSDGTLSRIDLFFDRHIGGRKNLLRTSAARSAISVVIPIDFDGHIRLSPDAVFC